MNNNQEELITALYDMIQDAKSVPLSSDKCIIERDRALDMLDDLSAQLPAELKQARTIVQSREELVSQARREAQIKAASFGYVDNSLRQTEETILKALGEVRDTRAKFQNITTKPAGPVVDNSQYDQAL